MEFTFDLQRFKGDTTVENSYTPTEYELELQKMQSDIANHYAPNAVWLNDVARQLLQNSIGAVQQDFNSLNQQAQQRINSAYSGLDNIIRSNSESAKSTNSKLNKIINQYDDYADYFNDAYESLVPKINQAQSSATNALNKERYESSRRSVEQLSKQYAICALFGKRFSDARNNRLHKDRARRLD